MRLILKLIAAPLILFLTVLVAVLLFLVLAVILPPDSGLGHHGSAGRGTVLHQLSGGRRHLSGDCVSAFPLWLAGRGGRCHHGAGQPEPVSAPVHHKLTASGQVGPK